MQKIVFASILGVGSELTSGQITNKNASWISQKLKESGLQTSVHLVVPDDKKLIVEGLDFCAIHSDLIFVTGGLGPTSDDFTRDLVAEWSGLPLQFDDKSWKHVVDRLTTRGFVVHDFQKQQCFFPKGSRVLTNNQGTANGFYFKNKGKDVFVLPGPPREIETLWKDEIQSWLNDFTKDHDKYLTISWDTLGRGESDIARITEEILKGTEVEIGYRVHLPYVEVKVSFFESERQKNSAAISKLEQALAPFTVLRNGEDAAVLLGADLQKYSRTEIHDEVTRGFLIHRLQPALKDLWKENKINFLSIKNPALTDENTLSLSLTKIDELTAKAQWKLGSTIHEELIQARYTTENMKERRTQFWAEKALLFWKNCSI